VFLQRNHQHLTLTKLNSLYTQTCCSYKNHRYSKSHLSVYTKTQKKIHVSGTVQGWPSLARILITRKSITKTQWPHSCTYKYK